MSSTSLSTLLYFYIFFLMAPFSGRLFSHHSKMTLGLNAHNPISVAQDWNKKNGDLNGLKNTAGLLFKTFGKI